jgi:hypothetical protein
VGEGREMEGGGRKEINRWMERETEGESQRGGIERGIQTLIVNK